MIPARIILICNYDKPTFAVKIYVHILTFLFLQSDENSWKINTVREAIISELMISLILKTPTRHLIMFYYITMLVLGIADCMYV